MNKETKTYIIVFVVFLGLAALTFFAGRALGKRGDNEWFYEKQMGYNWIIN